MKRYVPRSRALVSAGFLICLMLLTSSGYAQSSLIIQLQPGADVRQLARQYGFSVARSVDSNTGLPTYVIAGSNLSALRQTLGSASAVRWVADNSTVSVALLDGGETVLPLDGGETVLPLDGGETVLPLGPGIPTVTTQTIQQALGSVLKTLDGGETVLPLDGGETVLPLDQIRSAYEKVASLTVGSPALILQPAFGKIAYYGAVLHSTGRGISIADLDTGVDTCHPALTGVLTYNFVPAEPIAPENCPLNGTIPGPGFGHGTEVASLLRVLAPEASIWSLRIFDSKGTADVATIYEAVVWAVDHGVTIINMSFGTDQTSNAIRDAVAYATAHGVLVTGAAGNSNQDDVMDPAGIQPSIAVAATDLADLKTAFSNFNSGIDVSAPGARLVAAYPGNRFAVVWGTSYAAPMVAAEGALVAETWSSKYRHSISPGLLRSIIHNAVDSIDYLNPQYSGKLGSGRINLWKAYLAIH